MSGLGKTRAGWASGSCTERHFGSDMLIHPEDGWAVQRGPTPVDQVDDAAGIALSFPAEEEAGIGFFMRIPSNSSVMQLRLMSSVITDERVGVSPRLYYRPKGRAWRGPRALSVLWFEDQALQDDTYPFTLERLKLKPGEMVQFEVSRNPQSKGDTYSGKLALHWIGVNFA